MCGFVGSVDFHQDRAPAILPAAANRIRWRGPDAYREVVHHDRVLAGARLAVIDLDSEADQPIASPDGRWELVFNGEIYNYHELAVEFGLKEKALRSDSWALLQLIERLGVLKVHQRLRGMYAFAAWDVRENRLWLVRDPFGIKPLAWTRTKTGAIFASDPRAVAIIRRSLDLPLRLDEYALSHYLLLGYIPGDATAWEQIMRCEPGSVTSIDAQGTDVTRWETRFAEDIDLNPSTNEVDTAIRSAVKRHLISDVEVGAFLSGGIDSSLLVALARRLTDTPIRTFSVGFDAPSIFDESVQAEATARAFECKHETLRIGLAELQPLAEKVADAFPEPHADAAAMPMLALSERASTHLKVVLTGEGGDEIFGGYRRYWALPLVRNPVFRLAATTPLGDLISAVGGRRAEQLTRAARAAPGVAYAHLLTSAQWGNNELGRLSLSGSSASHAVSRYGVAHLAVPRPRDLRVMELQLHLPESYLEKDDRSTMRYGLEARVPFLDLDLARVAMGLSDNQLATTGRTKILLRKVAQRYLPRSLWSGRKRGFSVPLREWMGSKAVAQWVRGALMEGATVSVGALERDALNRAVRLLGDFDSDQKAEHAYRLLILELWSRQCVADGAL